MTRKKPPLHQRGILVLLITGVILVAGCTFPGQATSGSTPQKTPVTVAFASPPLAAATQTPDNTMTITPKGQALARFIDSMNVTSHWLSGTGAINWTTGDPDLSRPAYSSRVTHCSNFVAAATLRLGVYILRPPEHDQDNLVNAQNDWLNSQVAKDAGWTQIPDAVSAQYYANQGYLVVTSTKGSDRDSSDYAKMFGHIAIVRPSVRTRQELVRNGPQLAQAGWIYSANVSLRQGYSGVDGAWNSNGTGSVQFFMHPIDDRTLDAYS
ncbi:MAG: hypothetical protein WC586_02960 [Methanoregula sp.]